MSSRLLRGAAATLALLGPLCSGCTPQPPADSAGSAVPSAAALPSTSEELESLLLAEVPSGLPLVPDDELDPPAGEKSIEDLARYGDDSDRQREVLQEYDYLRGWERFWRSGDALTSVFLDQFGSPAGAASYAEDLARNDAEYYGGVMDRAPGDLPAGCVLMVRDDSSPRHGLAGPAAFAWCASGVFTVAVAAVAADPAAARAELTAVTTEQLDRLPSG
jgi:hypothetical protein